MKVCLVAVMGASCFALPRQVRCCCLVAAGIGSYEYSAAAMLLFWVAVALQGQGTARQVLLLGTQMAADRRAALIMYDT